MTALSITAWATVVIAAFTIILGVTGAVQAWLTRIAIRGAEASSERQLRAYVNVDDVHLHKIVRAIVKGQPGYVMTIKITVKNWGQTPAEDYTGWAHGEYCAGNSRPTLARPLAMEHVTKYSMPPGGKAAHFVEIGLEDSRYDALELGINSFYVFGELRYYDVFGNPQETDFLSFLGGKVKLKGDGAMARAPYGNRAT